MIQVLRSTHGAERKPLEALAGTVERVTFHNAENGFAVLKVQARGKRDLITVVGRPFLQVRRMTICCAVHDVSVDCAGSAAVARL